MNFFRRLISSKLGGYIALIFLLLVGLAFAAGDITGNGGLSVLGGPSSAEVARIGSETLTVNELQGRAQRYFERLREEKPELTMAQFLAQGGLKQVTDELIAVKALRVYGEQHGMRISKKLVDAEIATNPAFADVTGAFSQKQFTAVLAQQRVSEKELREDIARQIIQQHVLAAAGAGARAPEAMIAPFAGMLLEQRSGEMIAIPSVAYAPATPPTEAVLKAYFAAHPDSFTLPEQRKLRYVLIDRSRFDAQSAPTDAEIAQAYKAKAAQFAARDARDFVQLILPTEAQAKDIAAKAAGGRPLATLATEAGLATSKLTDLDQAKLAAQTNPEMAAAGFAAAKGAVAGPVKTPLGWALLHVEDVRRIPGKTLEQAKAELIPEIKLTKSKQLLADYVNTLDGKLGEGATLAELAKTYDLPIVETPFITGEGRSLKDALYKPEPVVAALLKPGFAMAAGDDPQIVSVKPDEQAAVLVLGDTIAAGPPPFAEARAGVEIAWRLAQGATKARDTATKVAAAINRGVSADEALKQAGAVTAPRKPLAARRVELTQGAKIAPPMRALFTLRQGSAQVVPMDQNQGFLVVRLDKIVEEDPRPNAQLMQSTRAGLSNVFGSEYARQLMAAIQQELNATRNPAAIASVELALRKANGAAQ